MDRLTRRVVAQTALLEREYCGRCYGIIVGPVSARLCPQLVAEVVETFGICRNDSKLFYGLSIYPPLTLRQWFPGFRTTESNAFSIVQSPENHRNESGGG